MKHTDNQQIDRYLRQEMSPGERLDFEAKIATDPALRQAMEETRQLAEGIRFAAGRDIRRRADAAREHYHQAERWRNMRPKIWVAGGLVLLAGLLWFGLPRFFDGEKLQPTEIETPTPTLPKPPVGPVASDENPSKTDGKDTQKETLGQMQTGAKSAESVPVLNADGSESGEKIRVEIFEDAGSSQRKYLFTTDALRFFIPPGTPFPARPTLVRRGTEIFLKMPDGEHPLPKREKENPF